MKIETLKEANDIYSAIKIYERKIKNINEWKAELLSDNSESFQITFKLDGSFTYLDVYREDLLEIVEKKIEQTQEEIDKLEKEFEEL